MRRDFVVGDEAVFVFVCVLTGGIYLHTHTKHHTTLTTHTRTHTMAMRGVIILDRDAAPQNDLCARPTRWARSIAQ